jgi:hypothetical protein
MSGENSICFTSFDASISRPTHGFYPPTARSRSFLQIPRSLPESRPARTASDVANPPLGFPPQGSELSPQRSGLPGQRSGQLWQQRDNLQPRREPAAQESESLRKRRRRPLQPSGKLEHESGKRRQRSGLQNQRSGLAFQRSGRSEQRISPQNQRICPKTAPSPQKPAFCGSLAHRMGDGRGEGSPTFNFQPFANSQFPTPN